jgi:hypothetical protein
MSGFVLFGFQKKIRANFLRKGNYREVLLMDINLDELGLDELTREIVEIEWLMFHGARNIGGPARCQEDPRTFGIMRASQALAWPEETRICYLQDLVAASTNGRNLMEEKYARMMQFSFPGEYRRIRNLLPVLGREEKELIEKLTLQSVLWAKEFSRDYPSLAAKGRAVTTRTGERNASLEAYCLGECSTYSLSTLRSLWSFYEKAAREGSNVHTLVGRNTVRFYGYASLEDAERGQAALSS